MLARLALHSALLVRSATYKTKVMLKRVDRWLQVRQQTAILDDGPIVTWNPVTPVIAGAVALVTDSSPTTQRGLTARLVVTFVEEGDGNIRSATDVTGFVSSDIEVTATALSEMGARQVLPVIVVATPVASIAYDVNVQPDIRQWPSSMLTDCTEVTLTLTVPGVLTLRLFFPHQNLGVEIG